MQAAIRVSIKFEKVRESFLTLGVPKSPEDGLVAERVLAALHHKLKLVVDIVSGLLRLLCGHHGCAPRRSDGGEDC